MIAEIRAERDDDREAIRQVNRAAFGQDAEAQLVDALRDGGFIELSLVAVVEGAIVGHILYSRIVLHTEQGDLGALALAPMAVLPEYQSRGIGSRLVEVGNTICREQGHRIVIVLGHPTFYPRFGFRADLARSLESPFGGGEAWMALELEPGSLSNLKGVVEYSKPFTLFE